MEDLIDEIKRSRGIERQSVKYHLREMESRGDITTTNGFIQLVDPPSSVVPSPLQSWRIVGIGLSIGLLLIATVEKNPFFILSTVTFFIYSLATNVEEILKYSRKLKNKLK